MPLIPIALAMSTAAVPPAGGTCPNVAPVTRVEGVNWYSDAAGSKVNAGAMASHQAMIQPLRAYATGLVQAIERGDAGCAQRNLSAWAKADALLVEPSDFAGQRERLRFATAISFATLRLIAAGNPPERGVADWIGRVNTAAVADFRRRGTVDNLYVWSGVAAALAWEITRDPALCAYAGDVLDRTTTPIGQDGLLASELRRQTRSLLYHSYYLSGLLVLTEALPATDAQTAAIGRLYGRVRAGSCAPADFPGGQPQTPPNADDLGTIALLASAQGPGALCGLGRAEATDPLRGGALRASLRAVRAQGAAKGG
jgi:hypothetical protein